MNEYNCNSLKSLPVPEKLIDKALQIPATTISPIPWYRRVSVLATAASILLVMTIGVTLYFTFRNINPPVAPTKPLISATLTPTISLTEPTVQPPSEHRAEATAPTIIPSQKPSQQQIKPLSPTEIPATQSTISPQEATSPVLPTEPAASAPPSKPTAPPTDQPSIVPQDEPTEHIEPVVEPMDPSEPPWISPTEEPMEPTDHPATLPTDAVLTFRTNFGITDRKYHGAVYCRIYNRDTGVVLGDPNRYADSHKAECLVDSKIVYVSYRPSDHGITLSAGNYSIAFHNKEGKTFNYYFITI